MTTTTTQPQTSDRRFAPIGLGTALVAMAGTAYGAHDWAEIAIVGAALLIATVVVFGVVVPRALRRVSAGGTALTLSVPALLLLLPAFWSGLPLLLGVAGAIVGNHGRSAPEGAGKSIAALVIGALAVLGYLASYIADGVIGGNAGFLFD